MLGIVAAIPIVLWLLGFLAFHANTALIHVALFASVILLVLYLMRQTTASA